MSEREKKPERVSDADRAHMRALGEANRKLARASAPPTSLAEMFARMAAIARQHGALAKPGADDSSGDMASHLEYLRRRKALGERRG